MTRILSWSLIWLVAVLSLVPLVAISEATDGRNPNELERELDPDTEHWKYERVVFFLKWWKKDMQKPVQESLEDGVLTLGEYRRLESLNNRVRTREAKDEIKRLLEAPDDGNFRIIPIQPGDAPPAPPAPEAPGGVAPPAPAA